MMHIKDTIRTITVAAILAAMPSLAFAEGTTDPEIEYLLTTIGSSQCIFTRNGTDHSSDSAEAHLRMKYSKARRHIADADEFIDRLASESSWTGVAYSMDCKGSEEQTSREWLTKRLSTYRTSN
jgi:hypothetical protein